MLLILTIFGWWQLRIGQNFRLWQKRWGKWWLSAWIDISTCSLAKASVKSSWASTNDYLVQFWNSLSQMVSVVKIKFATLHQGGAMGKWFIKDLNLKVDDLNSSLCCRFFKEGLIWLLVFAVVFLLLSSFLPQVSLHPGISMGTKIIIWNRNKNLMPRVTWQLSDNWMGNSKYYQ